MAFNNLRRSQPGVLVRVRPLRGALLLTPMLNGSYFA